MDGPSDETLLSRYAAGDEEAFVRLAGRHRRALAHYIRHRIGDSVAAEDVLQETLIAAWIGLRRIRAPASVRAWLLQVARNRCRDYFRAAGRQDELAAEQVLRERATRFGLHQHRHALVVGEVIEALEAAPAAAREAARRFYLDGLTVAEIAAESHCPPGTIKRRLFQARAFIRETLGVTSRQRNPAMESEAKTRLTDAEAPTFPPHRPEIVITESREPPFAVDCPELRWWSIVPRVGERASFADYYPPDWSLTEVHAMQALRPATVHGVEGVEVEVHLWKPGVGWEQAGTLYGRLTDDRARYLAVSLAHDGTSQLQTFLDDSFDWDWGEMDRVLEDRGHFMPEADGSLRHSGDAPEVGGAGVFSVTIGGKPFTCLRVLDGDVTAAATYLTESYLTREGRTVLVRRFCQPEFVEAADFEVVPDESLRLVINGTVFLHWYDTVTNVAQ